MAEIPTEKGSKSAWPSGEAQSFYLSIFFVSTSLKVIFKFQEGGYKR